MAMNDPVKKERRAMAKKAVFFTLISIMIVSLFLVYFYSQSDITLRQKVPVISSRVDNVNSFVREFENVYIKRALFATSQRALFAMTDYINETGNFVNLSRDFPNVLINGSIYDESLGYDVDLELMQHNTLLRWLHNLTDVSKKIMNLEIDFNITGAAIMQSDETGPWRARATLEVNYSINSTGIVAWRRASNVSVDFDIEGLVDPYISAKTDGLVNRRIVRTNINFSDKKNITQFVKEKSYRYQNITAPSFLMRFEGNTSTSSCCGIESLINTLEFGLVYEESASYVDYQFWSAECYDDYEGIVMKEDELYNITGVTSLIDTDPTFGFKLDRFHIFNEFKVRDDSHKIDDTCTPVT